MLNLKVLAEACFSRRVEFAVPTAQGEAAVGFLARFRVLGIEEARAHAGATDAAIRGLIEATLVGWEDVVDDAGEALPFTAEARDLLLDSPLALGAIWSAYWDGLREARRGN